MNYISLLAARPAPSERTTLICYSHLRWNFVFQRPQHLLSRAAKEYDVYYVEEPVVDGSAQAELQQAEFDGVHVATPHLPHGLDRQETVATLRRLIGSLVQSFGSGPLIEWYYTPMALEFTAEFKAHYCVYDCMDELSAFRGASPELAARERELFARADVVFTGGQSLYEAKRHLHRNVHAFPSSIDKAHFGKARALSAPTGQPSIGFFGVIDERMDVGLVADVARLRPDYQFVMVGPVVKIDEGSLPQGPNLHWLGSRRYQDLPSILGAWSLGFMPFAINEHTKFISPTKTPEFLAAGVPVASTAIADVVRPYGEQGLVEIVTTTEEAVLAFDRLLQRPKQPWLNEVDAFLKDLSWDATWAQMHALIDVEKHRLSYVRSTAVV